MFVFCDKEIIFAGTKTSNKFVMHRLIFLITLFWILFPSISINAQSSGEGLYKADCSACHTINGGRLIGPDLAGINELREQSWLISFIRSSQKMIKSGDSLAVAIYNEYSKLPMPDHNWSDEQIISVLNYIRETEDPLLTQAAAEKQVPDSALQQVYISYSDPKFIRGKALFYGYEKFTNGATTCIACHYTNDGSIIGGGKLAMDLTASYGRLGAAGIQAILTNSPFPAMNVSLRNNKLTDDEKEALTVMLQFVNDHQANKPETSRDELIFLLLSMVLFIFLLSHLYVVYDHRKLPS